MLNSSLIDEKYNPFKIEVPKKTAYVIDRFGKSRIIEEGFQDFFPFIDEIEKTVSLKEEIIYPDKLEIFTLDNQKITLDYRVFYKVINPVKALNNVYDYQGSLKSLIIISTLNVISNTKSNNISTSTIQKIRDEIEKKSKNWGIEIPQILFDDISL
ncbi:MAG: Unknown protein [uncultured Sulfurovum sp.]|uniref:Band 7 domain-containing protein n=1 Tax=uncultured Sulfurovum sp. TaxID=269237 RepID=A0A6S6U9M4_9BACT|nr:MAG: Unknown protein [uncultured Sulfurovum sp.]